MCHSLFNNVGDSKSSGTELRFHKLDFPSELLFDYVNIKIDLYAHTEPTKVTGKISQSEVFLAFGRF